MLKIDIRRVKLHEDIDKQQVKILEADGKKDNMVTAVKDEDINLLIQSRVKPFTAPVTAAVSWTTEPSDTCVAPPTEPCAAL